MEFHKKIKHIIIREIEYTNLRSFAANMFERFPPKKTILENLINTIFFSNNQSQLRKI